MAPKTPVKDKKHKPVTIEEMLEAGIEAIEHVAQANWEGREAAAKGWLQRIAAGQRGLSIEKVGELQETAREAAEDVASPGSRVSKCVGEPLRSFCREM